MIDFPALAVEFIVAEIEFALGLPVPTALSCAVIGFAAAATVISHSAMAPLYPKEAAERANRYGDALCYC